MCLIIVADSPKDVLTLALSAAWEANPHGAGFMYLSKRGELVARKGIMHVKVLKSILELLPDMPIAVHLRYATHGAPNYLNTHPWMLDAESALMHNGVLHNLGTPGDKGMSDSAHLAAILNTVKHDDRKALLDSLEGRYAYAHSEHGITVHGDFVEHRGMLLSNTYWQGRLGFNSHNTRALSKCEYADDTFADFARTREMPDVLFSNRYPDVIVPKIITGLNEPDEIAAGIADDDYRHMSDIPEKE
jgi:predicted glutamine amidotransferase